MPRLADGKHRILIYSHGLSTLGSLSRCRKIAEAIVDHRSDVSVLILSDTPTIGRYSFKTGIDFIYLPRVPNADAKTDDVIGLGVGARDALAVREALIRCVAEAFRPHLFLVDEHPLGLHGEIRNTVGALKSKGTHLVLGLSDLTDHVVDRNAQQSLWGVDAQLADIYDDIWVYGPREIDDGVTCRAVAEDVRSKASYTGYLCRSPAAALDLRARPADESSFILVTGGGDGSDLIDWVLSAYDYDPNLPYGCSIVVDPFMDDASRSRLERRIETNAKIRITTFVPDLDQEIRSALGVIGVGSYNTVCEILSTDRPAAIVPLHDRPAHRARAEHLQKLGLLQMLDASEIRLPHGMAQAIRDLGRRSHQPRSGFGELLSGLDLINQSVDSLFSSTTKSHLLPRTERPNCE